MNRSLWIVGPVCVFMVMACERAPFPAQGKPELPPAPKVIVEKETQKEKGEKHLPPPEVKIRLRKDPKGGYSWELNGSDADQILKVNEKLRKQLE